MAIVDYQLGGPLGPVAVAPAARPPHPPRVLVYSAFSDHLLAAAAIVAEASAVVSKAALPDELATTIRALARGEQPPLEGAAVDRGVDRPAAGLGRAADLRPDGLRHRPARGRRDAAAEPREVDARLWTMLPRARAHPALRTGGPVTGARTRLRPARPARAGALARDRERSGRYLPLVYRVAGINAGLLVAVVLVTLLVLDPDKLSRVALDEAIVLAAALTLVGIANLIVLRRVAGPLTALTELARTVDLTRPGTRMPDATPHSEAGELALTFNEMLARLEKERREATGRVLAGQEAERLRVAQELHDQIGQELTAVLLGLARARSDAADPELARRIGDLQDEVRSSLESVRRIAIELRPRRSTSSGW